MQEPACVHLGVGIVTTKLLDQDSFVFELPDLRDLERGVDAKPVDLRRRDIDFDRQVGVGIIGDIVGLASDGAGMGLEFVRGE